MARQDGCTCAVAAQLLQQVDSRAEAGPAHTGKDAAVQLSCRRILLQLTMLKVGPVASACQLHACTIPGHQWRQIRCPTEHLTPSCASLLHRSVHHSEMHLLHRLGGIGHEASGFYMERPEITFAIMALCREAKMASLRQHRRCASMEARQQQQPAAPSLLI